MLNIYSRFFKVTTGPVIPYVKNEIEIGNKAHIEYKAILKDIGAEPDYYARHGKLVSVIFPKGHKVDQKIFKRIGQGWYPKKNIKEGLKLHQRFKNVKPMNIDGCLKLVGLYDKFSMVSSSTAYTSSALFINKNDFTVFIRTPWADIDPEKLKEYKESKNTGDMNMDHLLWEPTEDMHEVKEWQMLKEIDEWNDHIESKEKGESE